MVEGLDLLHLYLCRQEWSPNIVDLLLLLLLLLFWETRPKVWAIFRKLETKFKKTNEHLEQPGGRCQEVILPSKPKTHHQTWLS